MCQKRPVVSNTIPTTTKSTMQRQERGIDRTSTKNKHSTNVCVTNQDRQHIHSKHIGQASRGVNPVTHWQEATSSVGVLLCDPQWASCALSKKNQFTSVSAEWEHVTQRTCPHVKMPMRLSADVTRRETRRGTSKPHHLQQRTSTISPIRLLPVEKTSCRPTSAFLR